MELNSQPNTTIGMHGPDIQSQRPFDELSRGEISAKHVEGFLTGCAELSEIIKDETPDIIFVPLRGAVPITLTASLILGKETDQQDDRETHIPMFVELPIGTHETLDQNNKEQTSGLKPNEKRTLISAVLASLKADGKYVPGVTRLMLVDEVQTGSTLTAAANIIRDEMDSSDDQSDLRIVAMQDNRANNPKRLDKYVGLTEDRTGLSDFTEGKNSHIKATVIELPLFTVDRNSFLDRILRFDESLVSPNSYENINNTSARRLFGVLANFYNNPDEGIKELMQLRRGEVARDLGRTIVQQEILENITDPIPVKSGRSANLKQSLEWWTKLGDLVKKSKQAAESAGNNIDAQEPALEMVHA